MPLIKSKSKAAFSKNVAAEVKAGKPVKQAVAIAYSESEKKKSSPEDREKVYKKHPYLRPKSDAK